MRSIKVGVIGVGFIGAQHIDAIHRIPGANIIALAEPFTDVLAAARENFCVECGYENWQDLIANPEIQVIHNCTPNHLHDDINRAAIMAGKHIYSEKPLSLTAKMAHELYILAGEKNVAHAVNHQYRLNAAVQEMRQRIAGGDCGRTLFIRGHYLQESHARKTDYSKRLMPETSPLRALADIGTHWADLACFISGKRIVSVYADMHTHHPVRIDPQTGNEIPIHSDDTTAVLLRFEDGTPGIMLASKVASGHKNDIMVSVEGEQCEFTWRQELPDRLNVGCREQPNGELFMNPNFTAASTRPYITTPAGHVMGWSDTLRNAISSFYTSIWSSTYAGSQPYATFEDGWHTILFMEACLLSAREKRWVNPYEELMP